MALMSRAKIGGTKMKIDKTIHTIVCDICGADLFEDTGYSGGDMPFVESELESQGWLILSNKHYCTKCYEYNDDDEVVIKDTCTCELPIIRGVEGECYCLKCNKPLIKEEQP